MNETGKLPWVKFSFDDYVNDLALSRCSLQAQAIWMRMLGIMHHGEPYGHLATNGVPMGVEELASRIPKMSGQRGAKRVTKCIQELLKYGAASQTKDGVLYCRRMVRDESIRLINKANGEKGGNPNIKKSVNPPVNPPVNPDVEVEKGLQPKPLGSKTAVKHPPRARAKEGIDTASLAHKSQRRWHENGADSGPPEPIKLFCVWVKNRLPSWALSKAWKVWQDPDDKIALENIFRSRALFEIQAAWQVFIRPGSKQYDYASRQRFSMREFKRQIDYLVDDTDYPLLKRRFMVSELAEARV